MDISEWGSCGWKFLHTCTFAQNENISPEKQDKFIKFFNLLGSVLPCSICGAHFNKFIKDHPLQVNTREDLCRWLVHAHNNVNKLQNKPEMKYEEVKLLYSLQDETLPEISPPFPIRANYKNNYILLFVIMFLFIVISICIGLLVFSCINGRCPINKQS